MNVTFEKKDDFNAIISVQITNEDYKENLDKQFKDYRKKAKIPGFRPGTVPIGMVKQMIGRSALFEEVNRLTSEQLYKYLQDNKIDILGQPMTSEEKESITHVIHTYIANIFDNPDNIDDIKDSTPLPFNETINRLILVESIDNKSIYNFLGLKNNSADELSDDENKVTNHKDIINILCNLTKVLIKKDLVNEYDKINVNKSNIKNTTKAFTDSYEKYMKEKRKVKLFYSISKLQNNYNKKEEKLNNKDAYEFIREYKGKLENYKQDINKEVNEYNLYLDN